MVTEDLKKAVLEEARKAMMEDHDDPKSVIIETVFRKDEARELGWEELDELIQSTYLMTRGKLGILDPLAEDEDVTEIMVNGKDSIFYEKNGRIERYGLSFNTTEDLEDVMRNIAGSVHREINELNPIVDARLEDGSRVNGVYKNIALNGPILTIRKFSGKYITMDDLVGNGTVTDRQAEFLRALVESGYNLFISGGTSSGKTTLLNALSDYIPKEERVIVIEDSMELKLSHIENIVHMECRNANSRGKGLVTMADLIKTSLRMRPDRIIVGEVRGGEVVDMLQAMNTGHSGSMSTGHGNSTEGMLKRLESMYLMSVPLNVDAIRAQIAEGVDVLIHLERDRYGKRRIVEMKELLGYENGEFALNNLMLNGRGMKDLRKAEERSLRHVEILRRGTGSWIVPGEAVF
ncbi:MAG: CpaF family protein [Firmicutes bacterium]|nr:CpaF family protein [Bacillota bacterium]